MRLEGQGGGIRQTRRGTVSARSRVRLGAEGGVEEREWCGRERRKRKKVGPAHATTHKTKRDSPHDL